MARGTHERQRIIAGLVPVILLLLMLRLLLREGRKKSGGDRCAGSISICRPALLRAIFCHGLPVLIAHRGHPL